MTASESWHAISLLGSNTIISHYMSADDVSDFFFDMGLVVAEH